MTKAVLAHHGIKGMKWGVRRTPECQRRCDFVIFRRTGTVRKWRVEVCSL